MHILLLFGPLILSVCEENIVKTWDRGTCQEVTVLPMSQDSFTVTAALHPQTYLNKVLFGSEQGGLELWNMKTVSMVYQFKSWGSPVLVLEQAPALDVVGVGLANGLVVLHNIKCVLLKLIGLLYL